MNIVAVVVSGADNLGIGLSHCWFLGEFLLYHSHGTLNRTVKKPADESKCEDIAAFQHSLRIHA